MQDENLTGEVIAACFDVINELGAGFVESVYEKALLIVLRGKGFTAESQVPMTVRFRGQSIGDYVADILVEGKLIVELKAVKTLLPEHQAQLINYLKATGIETGLLVNFGNPRLDFKRAYKPKQPG